MKLKLLTFSLLISQVLCVGVLMFPQLALAQGSATTSTSSESDAQSLTGIEFLPLTQIPGIDEIASSDGIANFLNQLYRICIGLGAVLAVLMIMRAGLEFMTSQGSVRSNEKARTHLSNAILGLVLLLSPVVVFSVINPEILDISFDFTDLHTKSSAGGDGSDSSTSPTQSCGTGTVQAVPAAQSCSKTDISVGEVAATCCTPQAGYKCCAKATKFYVLAYTYDRTAGTGKPPIETCVVQPAPKFYAIEADCKSNADSATIGASMSAQSITDGYNYGNLKILKSCTLVTDATYTIPTDPKACTP
jgi:hypothetical protein